MRINKQLIEKETFIRWEYYHSFPRIYKFDIYQSGKTFVFIELKPLLGDDYPEVLRKMATQIKLTRNDRTYSYVTHIYNLIVKDFNSSTTTREQLVQIFLQHDIKVIFLEDLEIDRLQQIDNNILRLQQEILKLQEERDKL